ncbi:MAG TPA: YggT family protein, partial [Gemmatimonadales bacterium]|nr:YggT family protein [Gemmatimonadales bacterium]
VRYGPRGITFVIVTWTYAVLVVALWVRVIGSWFGAFRYNRWVRPAYFLTDWIVEPIRRVLPQFGAFDWSPLAAWAALWVLKTLIVRIV